MHSRRTCPGSINAHLSAARSCEVRSRCLKHVVAHSENASLVMREARIVGTARLYRTAAYVYRSVTVLAMRVHSTYDKHYRHRPSALRGTVKHAKNEGISGSVNGWLQMARLDICELLVSSIPRTATIRQHITPSVTACCEGARRNSSDSHEVQSAAGAEVRIDDAHSIRLQPICLFPPDTTTQRSTLDSIILPACQHSGTIW